MIKYNSFHPHAHHSILVWVVFWDLGRQKSHVDWSVILLADSVKLQIIVGCLCCGHRHVITVCLWVKSRSNNQKDTRIKAWRCSVWSNAQHLYFSFQYCIMRSIWTQFQIRYDEEDPDDSTPKGKYAETQLTQIHKSLEAKSRVTIARIAGRAC
jgi:hypothetical protein